VVSIALFLLPPKYYGIAFGQDLMMVSVFEAYWGTSCLSGWVNVSHCISIPQQPASMSSTFHTPLGVTVEYGEKKLECYHPYPLKTLQKQELK
jgi:hypothetical protein